MLALLQQKNSMLKSVVNAKRYAVGTMKETFRKYKKLDMELPAMGYSKRQIKDLEETINRAKCDIVISATPTDLTTVLKSNKPILNVRYELVPRGNALDAILTRFIRDFVG